MRVLCFGEILFDHIEGVHYLGGAPTNFAGHSAKLGARTYLISAVGDDELGRRAVREIAAHGVMTDHIGVNGYATGTVEVELKEGIPSYDIAFSAWDHIAIDEGRLSSESFDVFYFGSLSQRSDENRRTLLGLLEEVSYTDTFFDVNLRQEFFSKEILAESLSHTTILKLNDEELPVISSMIFGEQLDEIACFDRLREIYPIRIMLLTCGKDGAKYFTSGGHGQVVPEDVPVVDTVGAGDSFSAGFMQALLKTGDVQRSVEFAAGLANHVVSSQGALPEYPEELLEELERLS